MASLGELVVKLSADVVTFQRDLGKAQHMADRAARQISNAFSTVQRLAGTALVGFSIGEIIKRTTDAERSLNGVATALRTTGFAAGITSSEVEEMAEALKKASRFDDDEIRKGIVSLLRFRDVQGDIFRQAVKLAPDLAVALDKDITAAFQRIGRALSDPEKGMKGLREAGVKLSDQQIELAKRFKDTGDIGSAQRIVIDAMAKSFGGSASGENTGLFKSVKDVEKAYDSLLKTIGKTSLFNQGVTNFYGFLEQSLKDIETIINRGDWVEKLLATAAFAGGFRGFNLSEPPPLRPGEVKGKIRGAVTQEDMAAAGKLQRDAERNQELLAARAKIYAQKRIELGKVVAESELANEKMLAEQRERILELFNAEGLISIKDYYSARRTIVEQALSGEVKALQGKMAQESEALQKAKVEVNYDKQISALTNIQKLLDEQGRLESAAGVNLIALTIQETIAAKKFEEQLQDVNIQLQEMQGNTVSAANARFSQQTRDLRKSILENKGENSPEMDQLKQLRDLTIAQAQFNALREEQSLITGRLQLEEDRLQHLVQTGAIGEIEGLARLGPLRARAVKEIEAQVVAFEELARIAGPDTPAGRALMLSADQARLSLEKLTASITPLADKFNTIFTDSFADAFSDFITGAKSAKDAFKSFANSVIREINNIVVKDLAKQLFGGMGSGGGIGGILAGIFGGGSNLNFDIPITPIDTFATGTDYVPRTGMYMLHQGESVTPASENRGGMTVVQNFTISAPVTRATQEQLARAAANGLATASRRG